MTNEIKFLTDLSQYISKQEYIIEINKQVDLLKELIFNLEEEYEKQLKEFSKN